MHHNGLHCTGLCRTGKYQATLRLGKALPPCSQVPHEGLRSSGCLSHKCSKVPSHSSPRLRTAAIQDRRRRGAYTLPCYKHNMLRQQLGTLPRPRVRSLQVLAQNLRPLLRPASLFLTTILAFHCAPLHWILQTTSASCHVATQPATQPSRDVSVERPPTSVRPSATAPAPAERPLQRA